MAMSRRKQLHPKSLKGNDEILFIIPDELQLDEESNEIIARTNLKSNHCFGPYPATIHIEDRIEYFQLLDIKHNWLSHCIILNNSFINLNIIFQNNQLFAIVTKSITIGKRLYLNKIILPKLNMNKDIEIKQEPNDINSSISRTFICNTCYIRFSNQNTLDAHRQHYCIKQEIRKSHSTDSRIKSMKRKSLDTNESPRKRLSLLSNKNFLEDKSSSLKLKNKSVSFNYPIQIGQYIYVPIPIIPTSKIEISKPLDLSKTKKSNNELINSPLDLSINKKKKFLIQQQIYQCEYCSIHFRSLKTLHAHQENYCKKNDNNNNRSQSPMISKSSLNDSLNQSSLFICRLCKYQGNTVNGMNIHMKFHLLNNEYCTEDDIIIKSNIKNQLLFKCKICSAMFDYEEILLNHMKCVHTNEILFECLECQSRFCSKWNLIRHMKFSHTNIKHDEDDDDNNNNNNNQQIESNDKSSDSMNLTRQIIRKSIDSKLYKKFSCSFCHIKFNCIDTLKQHMLNYCSLRPKNDEFINDIKKKDQNDTYCSSCQILFQHKSSYNAHKMYYCHNDSKINIKIPA